MRRHNDSFVYDTTIGEVRVREGVRVRQAVSAVRLNESYNVHQAQSN